MQEERMADEGRVAVKVWDLPVRLFHWIITVLFVFQLVTGKVGGDLMPWHKLSGYTILTLILFRILWGFAGSTHARFSSFAAGPAKTWRFARRLFSRQAVPQLGHNPLGGWSVMAMVGTLALQAVTGLFANDGVSHEGPLAPLVSLDVSNFMTDIHDWNVKLVVVLVTIHVLAVVFHLVVKRDEIVVPMFTGVKHVSPQMLRERREMPRGSPLRRAPSRERSASYIEGSRRALVLFLAAAAVVAVVVTVLPRVIEHAGDRNIPGFE
jgi:cytochrome b